MEDKQYGGYDGQVENKTSEDRTSERVMILNSRLGGIMDVIEQEMISSFASGNTEALENTLLSFRGEITEMLDIIQIQRNEDI